MCGNEHDTERIHIITDSNERKNICYLCKNCIIEFQNPPNEEFIPHCPLLMLGYTFLNGVSLNANTKCKQGFCEWYDQGEWHDYDKNRCSIFMMSASLACLYSMMEGIIKMSK